MALATQVLQVAFAVMSTPVLLSNLGKARYSELAIMWSLVFFAPLLDLGLPRVVARLGAGVIEEASGSSSVVALRTALRGQILIIAVATVTALGVVAAISPALVETLRGESGRSFIGFFAVLSCLLLSNILNSHLQGRGWLHRMTAIQSMAGILNAAVPLLLWIAPLDLGELALAFFMVRLVTLFFAIFIICNGENLSLRKLIIGPRLKLQNLVKEGSAGIAYFALTPIVVFGERYVIPLVSGISSFSAHLIAVDIGLRILVIPGLLSQYAFRSLALGLADRSVMKDVLSRYFSLVVPLFIFPILIVIFFGKEIINFWLGVHADPVIILCVKIVAAALGASSVSAILVQICIAASRTGALSRLVLIEVFWYIGAISIGSLIFRSPSQIAIMASVLWSIRIIINAAAIVRSVSKELSVFGIWRLLLSAVIPGFFGLGAGSILENIFDGYALWLAKSIFLFVFILVWIRIIGPWSLKALKH